MPAGLARGKAPPPRQAKGHSAREKHGQQKPRQSGRAPAIVASKHEPETADDFLAGRPIRRRKNAVNSRALHASKSNLKEAAKRPPPPPLNPQISSASVKKIKAAVREFGEEESAAQRPEADPVRVDKMIAAMLEAGDCGGGGLKPADAAAVGDTIFADPRVAQDSKVVRARAEKRKQQQKQKAAAGAACSSGRWGWWCCCSCGRCRP